MQVDFIRVSSIQRMCVYDGPGVRTVVFLKGCYLHCPWCCNPETINYNGDLIFNNNRCEQFRYSKICKECIKYGGNRKLVDCPMKCYEVTFKDYSPKELFDEIVKDKSIFQDEGGVTFSGGEPLLQSENVMLLLGMLKKEGVHIAYETTLFAPLSNLKMVINFVDYWMIDLKFQYGYIINSEIEKISTNDLIQNHEQLTQLVDKDIIEYRMVVMKEILKNTSAIITKLKCFNVKKITLLQYHSLAENKYKRLGKNIRTFGVPTNKDFDNLINILNINEIKVGEIFKIN